jgi:hypothetical protein
MTRRELARSFSTKPATAAASGIAEFYLPPGRRWMLFFNDDRINM